MPHRWSASAELRRQQIESGQDITFGDVFRPLYLQWVCALQPECVIEIGAGTGHLSKALVDQGFAITAVEPSEGMYSVAKEVLSGENVQLINCSLFELPLMESFDVAVSHLVAQVVDNLESFMALIRSNLRQGGHLIFSIPYPCFYNSYKGFFGDEYNYMTPMSKEVSFSISKDPKHIIYGVPYHHRPLSKYIHTIIGVGFSLDGFYEIYPPAEIQEKYGRRWETPRYCAFSCKKL